MRINKKPLMNTKSIRIFFIFGVQCKLDMMQKAISANDYPVHNYSEHFYSGNDE